MTGMQLLVPPLEENENQRDGSDMGPNSSNEGSSVLSPELREQFETMKSVWRRAKRSNGEEAEELRRKQQAVALDTAVAIESEMMMWENGIAELEAMLGEEEEEEGDEHEEEIMDEEPQVQPPEVVRFPNLPPIVPVDDEDQYVGKESSATTTDL